MITNEIRGDTCEDCRWKRDVSARIRKREEKEYLGSREEWQCQTGEQDWDSHGWRL